MVEPDEAEGEGVVGVGGSWGGADDGDGVAAFAKEGAGIVGGEGVFEIEIGREIEEAPAGELFREHGANNFAKVVAFGLFAERGGGGFGFVVESDLAGLAAEAFDGEGEATGPFGRDSNGTAVELAGFVPDGEVDSAGLLFDVEEAWGEGEREFAGFLEDGLAGSGEKGFNRGLHGGGMAPRDPLGGGCHYSDYRMEADGFSRALGNRAGADGAGGATGRAKTGGGHYAGGDQSVSGRGDAGGL